MSWWEALHIAISLALFVLVFIEGNDEPILLRVGSALFVAIFWLPMVILTVLFVASGTIGGKLKAWRK
jgi:hypothetical protein